MATDHASIPKVAQKSEALLGEGPVWDPRKEVLYWLDIKGRRLHAFSPERSTCQEVALETEVGAVAPRTGEGLVAATRNGFAFLDPDNGVLTYITDPESDLPDNRFNDGAIDRKGNFVAGSMDDLEVSPSGTVYWLNADETVITLFGGYVVCNGPAFSPDGDVLYFSNSAGREILAFPYDAGAGSVGTPKRLATIPAENGFPDGLTVDVEGYIWCAHWDGGRITRFDSTGHVDRVIEFPAPRVTSCAFGGAALDTLYVTTARWGLDEEQLIRFPLSGSLFEIGVGVKGFASPPFAEEWE